MKLGPTSMGTESNKHQAPSSLDPDTRVQIIQNVRHNVARQYVAASNKRQATSTRIPDSGFKQQASSVKRQAYLKNFLCLNIPDALVHVSGLRIPGSGFLFPHKVLER
jgi:hypothetical protein